MRQKKGFTLIELLVVVAIIATLISILLPAISTARSRGKQISCGAKLRGIGQYLIMYTDAYNNWLPESLFWSPGQYRMWSSEMYNFDPVHLNSRSTVYVCPDDPNPMEVLWSNYGPGAGFYSYAYNLRLGYAHRNDASFPGYLGGYKAARVSDLMDPTRFVAMYCAVLPSHWWFFDGPNNGWMLRHGGTTNLLMVDGHVVGRKAEDVPPPSVPEFHWGHYSLEKERW